MQIAPKTIKQIEGKYCVIIFNEGSIYYGDLIDNQMHGNGILRLSCGDSYQGDFENGLFNGNGYYTWSNGSKYLGQFLDGKLDGKGYYVNGHSFIERKKSLFSDIELFYCSWNYYSGGFKNNQPHGYGIVTDSRFDYIGYLEKGKFHGDGKLTESWTDVLDGFSAYSDNITFGEERVGNFENGELNGLGKQISFSEYESRSNEESSDVTNRKEEYNGIFFQGKFHGWGVLYFYENEKLEKTFKGIFQDGKPTENGVMAYSDGSIYIGDYNDNYLKHGNGKLINSTGHVKDGVFRDDEIIES